MFWPAAAIFQVWQAAAAPPPPPALQAVLGLVIITLQLPPSPPHSWILGFRFIELLHITICVVGSWLVVVWGIH